jgi:hypothetical protein
MLALRPNCEHCNKDLAPDALDAQICSYECTFCSNCVEQVLHNVCPNCGGGFTPRPIRPAQNRKNGNYLGNDPASTTRIWKPVVAEVHAAFIKDLEMIPAHLR